MDSYLQLVRTVLSEGVWKDNRTGKKSKTMSSYLLRHDMAKGFPLLTTKKMAFKSVRAELEFFIKGKTDKTWLQRRGCSIWDEWASPAHVKLNGDATTEDRLRRQKEETELGPIYGHQWRRFGEGSLAKKGVDQLQDVINTLKNNPNDRRMLVSAWNPVDLPAMALPPCHVLFHLVVVGRTLNLNWFQRSCDAMLGLPFNIASYGLLLHLLAKEAKLQEGTLSGMLSDVHVYEDHVEGTKEQLQRKPKPLPTIKTPNFTGILEWEAKDTLLESYEHHPKIPFDVAV